MSTLQELIEAEAEAARRAEAAAQAYDAHPTGDVVTALRPTYEAWAAARAAVADAMSGTVTE